MNTSTSPITVLLNATIASVKQFVDIQIGKMELINIPIVQTDFGVLIGIVGDLKGRLIIMADQKVFAEAAKSMYEMEISGEMLESFVGEFGNSVAGHTATKLSKDSINIDITPPTTMQGMVKFGGFNKAIQIPFMLDNNEGKIILAIDF